MPRVLATCLGGQKTGDQSGGVCANDQRSLSEESASWGAVSRNSLPGMWRSNSVPARGGLEVFPDPWPMFFHGRPSRTRGGRILRAAYLAFRKRPGYCQSSPSGTIAPGEPGRNVRAKHNISFFDSQRKQ